MKQHFWKSNINRLAVPVVLCLLAGVANGTFELQDPAQTVSKDLQNQADAERLLQDEANDLVAGEVSGDVGDTVCSEFVSHRQERSESYTSILHWLQGFTKGTSPDTSDEQDSVTIWIEGYCRENPSDSLAQAADAFVDEHNDQE